MASKNKTEHLGLNSWVLEDIPDMEDFNADNRRLDAAIAAKAEASGVYGKARADNLFARAIVGTASGNPAAADDLQEGAALYGVSLLGGTAQDAWEAGKNLFHHTMELPATVNGVTVSYDAGTGEYLLNGQVQSIWTRTVLAHVPFQWKGDQPYSISVEKVSGSVTGTAEKDFVVVAEAYRQGTQLGERFFADTQLAGGAASGSQTYTSAANLPELADELSIFFDPWFCEGNVYTDYRLRFQLEEGAPSAWERYTLESPAPDRPAPFTGAGEAGSITVSATAGARESTAEAAVSTPLYRLPDGTRDRLDLTQGRATRYAAVVSLAGAEAEGWTWSSTADGIARFRGSTGDAPLPAGTADAPASALSDRFRALAPGREGFEAHAEADGGHIVIAVRTGRLAGWADSLGAAEKAACFTVWLAAHPVGILYRRAEALETAGPYAVLEAFPPETVFTASDARALVEAVYARDPGRALAALEARLAALEAN